MKEIPFDYILISIMIILKSRNKETIITKDNLIKIIDIIVYNLTIDEKEKFNIINDFDLDYELDKFYNNYIEYFTLGDNNIYLDNDVTKNMLEDILLDNDVDELLLSEIDELLEININIIELMGIKIRKDIYKWLSDSLRKDEKLYSNLRMVRKNNNKELEKELLKEIKIHLFKRRILLLNLANLDIDTTYDLILYGDNLLEGLPLETIPFNIENNSFNESTIYNNIFQRILFIGNNSNNYITNYKLNYDLEKVLGTNLSRYQEDYKFYLTFYYLLCEEIEKLESNGLKEELDKTRYKLMMLIDGIFDNNLFMNSDISLLKDYISDYKNKQMEVYFFTEELLSYEDSIYYKDTTYTLQYFNIIKKLFIKTYYNLTNDNNIITIIKENKYYGINKISTSYLDDVINNSKKEIKKTK